MMTEQRRQELRDLCEKATPGPWFQTDIRMGAAPDREFIAASREALPELLAEVERLSKALEGRGPTVREAFALAGHPVPDFAKIFVSTGVTDKVVDPSDPFSQRIHEANWACVCPPTFGKLWDNFETRWTPGNDRIIASYYSGLGVIPVDNLPARDCLEALPQVVRDAIPADRQEGGA